MTKRHFDKISSLYNEDNDSHKYKVTVRVWNTGSILGHSQVTVFMPMFATVTWSASLPVFVAIFSCAKRIFSDPLMMKYPPGISGHSFNSVKSRSIRLFRRQYVDRSMMGMFSGAVSLLGPPLPLQRSL